MMLSAGMPISVAMMWAHVGSWPWPWLLEPTRALPRRAGRGEEGEAEPHDLAGLAALERRALVRLLLAQRGVVRRLHHLLHGGVIVAGIVFRDERRMIR